MEQLNTQALRTVLNSNLDYETLLKLIGSVNRESSRVRNMLVTTYKTLYGLAPPYLRSLLKERTTAYNLRGTLKLYLPRVTNPVILKNRGSHNLLWIKIGQTCYSSSMEYAA